MAEDKEINHHERTFCKKLLKWLHYNMEYSCVIEAKISEENKPFNYKSGFKPHQLPTLIKVRNGKYGYKISDIDASTRKPFDILFTSRQNSYVAIQWIRKGNNKFYLINPNVIQGEIDDGKKSLTEERAEKLASIIGYLK